MKKRLVLIILALCMLATLFSGCGTASSTPDPASSSSVSPAASTDAPVGDPSEPPQEESYFPLESPESVSILMAFGGDMFSSMDIPNDLIFWKNVEDILNVEITLECLNYGQVSQQVPVMIASDDVCDILFSSTIWKCGASSLDEGVDEGIWLDLTEYVDKYMPNYSIARTSDERTRKATVTEEGRLVGVFGIYDGGAVTEIGPFMRKDWLDALELEAPVTFDEYDTVLEAIYTEYAPTDTVYVSTDGTVNGSFFSAGFGVASDTALGEYPFTIEEDGAHYSPITDGYRSYLSMIKKWYDKGYISDDFMANSFNAGMGDSERITTDNCALFVTQAANISAFKASAASPEFEVVAVQSPRSSKDDVLHLGPKNSCISTSAVISTLCENVELVCRFMDWFYSEDGYYLCNYGVEGETYNVANGLPVYTDIILDNPDGLTPSLARGKYCWGVNGFYNINIRGFFEQTIGLQYCDTWEKDDNSYYYDKNLYIMDTDASGEFALYYSDISTYVSETTVKFIIGELDLETDWNDYVSHVQSLNIQTCEQMLQTAVDQYNAR